MRQSIEIHSLYQQSGFSRQFLNKRSNLFGNPNGLQIVFGGIRLFVGQRLRIFALAEVPTEGNP